LECKQIREKRKHVKQQGKFVFPGGINIRIPSKVLLSMEKGSVERARMTLPFGRNRKLRGPG
jgi:hypothetical protein